jgi:hypothetical protein
VSELVDFGFERQRQYVDSSLDRREEEVDPLENYLSWRHDFLKTMAAWSETESESRQENDAVLTGLASGQQGVLSAERLQLLQQSVAGSVSAQFLSFLTNPFLVGAMIVSFHSLELGGDGIEVDDEMPGGEHLDRYQQEQINEREQHRRVRARLAVA